ncbi:MAG: SDR family NAD(P)-dependent oxidoreductase [Ectothiorhodospiraceae bacterium]|nr:SDR family NAD(P)-dependent oxidoreductase [Ectothiorhodospiraceae bacterium]
MNKFVDQYGPWCVVTGASSGMGSCYAKEFASKGLNLVIVARRENQLKALASSITSVNTGIEVKIIIADLTTTEGITKLKKDTDKLDIGLLVNNAGREDSGRFLDISLEDAIKTLELNCFTPLQLTYHYAQKMKLRGKGGIIFMSSLVAYQGIPFVASYAGTKAYNLIFSESLADELKEHNIDVLVSTPGFTATELAKDWSFSDVPISPLAPLFVVRKTVAALGRKRVIVPGGMNKFLYFSSKYLQSRRLNTFLFGLVFKRVLKTKIQPL